MKKYGIFLLTFFFTFFLVTCSVKTIGHSSHNGDTSNLTTLLEFKFQNEVLGLSKDKIKTLEDVNISNTLERIDVKGYSIPVSESISLKDKVLFYSLSLSRFRSIDPNELIFIDIKNPEEKFYIFKDILIFILKHIKEPVNNLVISYFCTSEEGKSEDETESYKFEMNSDQINKAKNLFLVH